MLVSSIGFIFAYLVYKGNFGQIWIKIIDLSFRVENFHFRTFLQIMVFHFEYKKTFDIFL